MISQLTLRHIVAGTIAGALYLFSAQAFASDTFPNILKDRLGLKCEPTCLICHTSLEGGVPTLDGALSTDLILKYGVLSEDKNLLLTAITAIETKCSSAPLSDAGAMPDASVDASADAGTPAMDGGTDSGAPPDAGAPAPDAAAPAAGLPVGCPDTDGDGVSDLDDLRAGINPRTKGSICSDLLYGCGARIAPAPKTSREGVIAGVAALVLGLAAAASARRKK